MSCCCFSCGQQILLSINLSILGVVFFLISSLSSRCFSTRESAISAAAHSHLGGDLTSWLAPSSGGKYKFCWESSGSRKESGRSLPSLVGTVPTMASVYLGQLHVLHPLNTDDDRFVQSALLPPTDHSALTTHHHRHITIRIEHRRDHIHERIIPFCKL